MLRIRLNCVSANASFRRTATRTIGSAGVGGLACVRSMIVGGIVGCQAADGWEDGGSNGAGKNIFLLSIAKCCPPALFRTES